MTDSRRTSRPIAIFLLALAVLSSGCAAPVKLARQSEKNLAKGDIWKAWHQATRALDREPMNPSAKQAAAAAGNVIADDWQRRIHALASLDSLRAAEQVLAFTDFRMRAAHYTDIAVAPAWPAAERAIRRAAAHHHYLEGRAALTAKRPKAACLSLRECERYVIGYRDAAKLADSAFDKALTRIAVLPFATSLGDAGFGEEVASDWRDALAERLAPPGAQFTRLLGSEAVTGRMTVSQLGRLSRDEAVRLGRRSGADRIVWGSIGRPESETSLQYFRETISRRIDQKDAEGRRVTRWVDVPIEVVARVRDVTVEVDYEVISTRDGTSLAHVRAPRTTRARVVWTSFAPQGELAQYALVSETVRSSDPVRARGIESRWASVCGEGTTLQQVLAARRETRADATYDPGAIGRIVAGAAFVFLKELPPAEELARAAVRHGWQPLLADLARLDPMDDADLGVAVTRDER